MKGVEERGSINAGYRIAQPPASEMAIDAGLRCRHSSIRSNHTRMLARLWVVAHELGGGSADAPRRAAHAERTASSGEASRRQTRINDRVRAFVEPQWAVLVLPMLKRTMHHGHRAVVKVHVLPTWRDIPRGRTRRWA